MSPERRRRRRLATPRVVGLVAAAISGFAYGVLCHWLELPPYAQLRRLYSAANAVSEGERPRGNWHAAADRGLDDEDRASIAALGYLSAYEPRRSDGGVLAHDPGRAQPGYNLYTSGHAPSAFLMDMDGTVTHEWSHGFERAFPGDARAAKNSSRQRRAHAGAGARPVHPGGALGVRGTEENGFYSGTLGAAHRLDNDNTLIVESEAKRAFEVTPTLDLVWEFVNSARGGDDGEQVAALYDVIRVPDDQVAGWLELEGR